MLTQQPLLAIVGEALRLGGVETTLAGLVVAADATLRPLAAIPEIIETLEHFGLTMVPGTESGDLDAIRLVTRIPIPSERDQHLAVELAAGEGARIEYKQSMCHHHDRARAQPDASTRDLFSDELVEAVLRTICGFLNNEGGVLLVGVHDSGRVSGIESDFAHTGQLPDHRNSCDKWELYLRSVIVTRFHDGEVINNYVDVSCHVVDELTVARIRVQPRTRLAALKTAKAGYSVFLRRGNRTDRLEPWEIEELVTTRLQH